MSDSSPRSPLLATVPGAPASVTSGVPGEVTSAIQVLQRLAELFEERRCQLAREAGLTLQQWRVLEEISDEHFMPSMFARERESSAAAVSKILRQLLDRGLVRVAVSATDGRQRRYALTAAGRKVMDSLRASRRRAIEAIWLDLDPAELAGFTAFSSELVRRLETYAGADVGVADTPTPFPAGASAGEPAGRVPNGTTTRPPVHTTDRKTR